MNAEQRNGQDFRQSCLVCSHPEGSAHFGSTSCLACAAFFRRTVSLDITFECKKDGKCAVFHELRMMCRGCRYAKCISAGMQPHYVQKRRSTRQRSVARDDARGQSRRETGREETVIKTTIADPYYTHPADSPVFQPQCDEFAPLSALSPIPMLSEPPLAFEPPNLPENTQDDCNVKREQVPPHTSPTTKMLNISGSELLDHYVRELKRAMDRRCVMFTSCPMRVLDNAYGEVPYNVDRKKPCLMSSQSGAQRFDYLLTFEYCQAMPGVCNLTTNEKLIFFRVASLSFCVLDIAWITAKGTTREDNVVMFTDGGIASVDDYSVGWTDEEGMTGTEKKRLFSNYLKRFYSALVVPFMEYNFDRVEYAALKALCVWKLGYFEYTQKMRALAKEHETALLIGLDEYYKDRPDKAERVGQLILLMGTIFEMYHSIQETYQGIELFQLFKMDAISQQLLTSWVQP